LIVWNNQILVVNRMDRGQLMIFILLSWMLAG
jgi:hypothetical protein